MPFPNNIIPADRIDPAGAKIVSYFPAPNLNTLVNNLIQSGSSGTSTHLAGFRLDHAIGDRQRFFLRYSKNRENPSTPRWLDNAAQGFTGQLNGVNAIAGDYTLVLSPASILNLRYGFTGRSTDQHDPAVGFDLTSLGMPAAVANEAKLKVFPSVSTTGYVALGDATGENSFNYRTHSWQASITNQHGSHTLKAGADLRLLFVDQRRGIDPRAHTRSRARSRRVRTPIQAVTIWATASRPCCSARLHPARSAPGSTPSRGISIWPGTFRTIGRSLRTSRSTWGFGTIWNSRAMKSTIYSTGSISTHPRR